MQIIKSSNVKEQKSYEPPKLVRQGHVSQVTEKSGTAQDGVSGNFQFAAPPAPESSDSKGSSGEVFDNFFDN